MDNYEIKVYYENRYRETIAIIRNRWLKFRIDPRCLMYRGFELSRFDDRLNVMYYFDSADFKDLGLFSETSFSVIADKIIAVIIEAKNKVDNYLNLWKEDARVLHHEEQKPIEPKKVVSTIVRRFKL